MSVLSSLARRLASRLASRPAAPLGQIRGGREDDVPVRSIFAPPRRIRARIEHIRRAGGDPFYEYQIPQAAIALKQGFGRLIRSRSDRGVLVLLDHRINKKRAYDVAKPRRDRTSDAGAV